MKNIFVKLSKHSFIRIYDEGKLGYILNQRTELDRVYNDIGADFLSQITRTPRSLYEIVNSLLGIYKNVSREAISNDFLSFIEELHKYGFVEVAESINLFAVNEIPNQEVVLSETHKKKILIIKKRSQVDIFGLNTMQLIQYSEHFMWN